MAFRPDPSDPLDDPERRELAARLAELGSATVPEVLVAVHAGLRVLALSVVTNVCQPDTLTTTSGEEVVDVAQSAEPKMTAIVSGVIEGIGNRE